MSVQLSLLDSAGTESRSVIDAPKRVRACGHSQRLPVGDALRRARRTDPSTSHTAAERAAEFAASHAGRIHLALLAVPNATGKELMARTGMSNEQICRRLPELEALGLARVVMVDGKPLVREGARAWEAVRS